MIVRINSTINVNLRNIIGSLKRNELFLPLHQLCLLDCNLCLLLWLVIHNHNIALIEVESVEIVECLLRVVDYFVHDVS